MLAGMPRSQDIRFDSCTCTETLNASSILTGAVLLTSCFTVTKSLSVVSIFTDLSQIALKIKVPEGFLFAVMPFCSPNNLFLFLKSLYFNALVI